MPFKKLLMLTTTGYDITHLLDISFRYIVNSVCGTKYHKWCCLNKPTHNGVVSSLGRELVLSIILVTSIYLLKF